MLVLKRKIGEQVVIGGSIRVKVLSVNGTAARLGFEADEDVLILREELCEPDLGLPIAETKETALVY
jgi:carbon storage regulator CsrA